MSPLDITLFFVAVIGVIAFGLLKSRAKEADGPKNTSDYFLAGRGLTWWLVGFSLIAANISTEQFVGMSGQAADWLGMAIASYEWMAAITLVVIAFLFLPRLLRCGIYTIPEFLEYRYGVLSRTIMAIATMVILVGVPTASVIYSGAKVISVFFSGVTLMGMDMGNLSLGCWIIGLCAAGYVFIGGLKACAWTDLIWGSSLILGGALVMFLAFQALEDKPAEELIQTKVATSSATVDDLANANALERLHMLTEGPAVDGPNGSGGKLHMIRPAKDSSIPWTALIIGLWIPNFFYWGLNQYIMQRTLGSKSLAEGQKGIIFAAGLKLIVPFVVVIPGLLAYHLYSSDLQEQAQLKNEAALTAMEAGETVVLPFSEHFARLYPDKAAAIIQHNADVVGTEAAAPDPQDAPYASGEMADANAKLVAAAQAKKIKVSAQLVGFDYDAAFPTLLRNLLKPGYTWFVLAAIFGAVVSSLASMLNSASTIATMDIYHKLRKGAGQTELVSVGRVCVVAFVLIACVIAPNLGRPEFGGIFTFIQEFQGFLSPGILAVFLFGFLVHRCPRYAGWLGILLNVVLYGSLKFFIAPEMAFLNRMAVCFGVVLAVLAILTLVNPLKRPVEMPENKDIELVHSRPAKIWGTVVCVATLTLYIIFW
ncbi:sodium/solute symporter [Ruficoccus sp. ZRK36]|uniref:sodium:solute symporter family transporter n=1 Tax=Ruficoccus sp. ZRK36 TaxID=2866311 RepID=UPI001C737060|nr:sodium/solute symporter [Ruficoccus sp. ZRK36]QYY34834.1 sodium/solute symporter [Ruficoccus sp. ZRK36]